MRRPRVREGVGLSRRADAQERCRARGRGRRRGARRPRQVPVHVGGPCPLAPRARLRVPEVLPPSLRRVPSSPGGGARAGVPRAAQELGRSRWHRRRAAGRRRGRRTALAHAGPAGLLRGKRRLHELRACHPRQRLRRDRLGPHHRAEPALHGPRHAGLLRPQDTRPPATPPTW